MECHSRTHGGGSTAPGRATTHIVRYLQGNLAGICDLFCFIARVRLAQNPSSKYLPGPHPALGYARTGAYGSQPQLVTLQRLHAAGSRRGERALGKDHSQLAQKLAFCGPSCILPRRGRFEYSSTHKACMTAVHQSVSQCQRVPQAIPLRA